MSTLRAALVMGGTLALLAALCVDRLAVALVDRPDRSAAARRARHLPALAAGAAVLTAVLLAAP